MNSALVGVLLIPPTVRSLIDQYPTASILVGWGIAMLSYHQDARRHDPGWAIFSQILGVVLLIALVVFGFTHKSWHNFVIAPPLI